MAFVTELWESVFTPGTTPALIKATHASFILLILSLIWLICLSRSIHFINLLVIAVLLYAAVIWFVGELEKVKLEQKNQQSLDEQKKETTSEESSTSTGNLQQPSSNSDSPARKRKV